MRPNVPERRDRYLCQGLGKDEGRRVVHRAALSGHGLAASLATLHSWRQGRIAPSYSFHLGGVLVGWGIFNLVEGVVDHLVLGVHHVRDDLGGPLAWDLGFLAVGIGLVVAGWVLMRVGSRSLADRSWVPTPVAGAGGG